MTGKYDDIIDLPHHTSTKHTPMAMNMRAAQFSPFAALTGYDAAIAETERLTDQKIELDENEKELLDEKIQMVMESSDKSISMTYFVEDEKKTGGKYITLHGKVAKIDVYDKIIVMDNHTSIRIDDILSIDL